MIVGTDSDRIVALDLIWNRLVDAYVGGDMISAQTLDVVYTVVERMNDYEFARSYRDS